MHSRLAGFYVAFRRADDALRLRSLGATHLTHAGWLKGLKLAAVAIVAQAVWAMATKICPDRVRASVALAAAATMLVLVAAWAQIAVLATGALFGCIVLREREVTTVEPELPLATTGWSRRAGAISLCVFAALLFGLPVLRATPGNAAVAVFDSFYRSGALVFGGGHVVLPLLQAETVTPGWVGDDRFRAGYGLAQAVPGPLFSFAAYLGTVLTPPRPGGWIGSLLCLLAIYLPSGLLVLGILPFWENLRRRPAAQATLRGANAAVVGLLLVALYHPVWTSAVHTSTDLAFALVLFGLLMFWKLPPWMIVGLAAADGELLLKG